MKARIKRYETTCMLVGYYDEKGDGHSVVSTWAEFTAALAAGKTEIMLGADITYDKTYTLSKDVVIDLNGKTLVMGGSAVYFGIKATATLKNGNINKTVVKPSNNNVKRVAVSRTPLLPVEDAIKYIHSYFTMLLAIIYIV